MNRLSLLQIAVVCLSMLMVGLCYSNTIGISAYYDGSNPVSDEGRYVVGFTLLYSAVVWMPYLCLMILFHKRFNKRCIIGSSIPFILFAATGIWFVSTGL